MDFLIEKFGAIDEINSGNFAQKIVLGQERFDPNENYFNLLRYFFLCLINGTRK